MIRRIALFILNSFIRACAFVGIGFVMGWLEWRDFDREFMEEWREDVIAAD